MSSPVIEPLSVTDEANKLLDWITVWCDERGGEAKVMANMRHLWEELFVLQEQPRVLIVYMGENVRGSFDGANTSHRVDRQWAVVIVKGHGFKNLMSEPRDGSAEPFYDSVELLRDRIRVMLDITEEPPVDYKGIKPLPNMLPTSTANAFADAYMIEFSTANDMARVKFSQADNP